jgi:EAL domain-containing protein (putative c-di-GMP-specific phosphodiesterase class I)
MQDTYLESATPISNLKVLVIDDVASRLGLQVKVLKALGVREVIPVASLAKAAEVFGGSSHTFDVALCDRRIGDEDCFDYVAGSQSRNVRAFILTAWDERPTGEHDPKVGRHKNLVDVLDSPLEHTKLRSALLRYCVRHGMQRPISESDLFPQWTQAELSYAMELGQFMPYFQPKVDLETGRTISVEMLARWNHPFYGIVPPSAFIPLMEREPLIDRLTKVLFRTSLQTIAECPCQLGLAVNVAAKTLEQAGTVSWIIDTVAEYGIDPQRITIEVTETTCGENSKGVIDTLTRLRLHGLGVSVDDFGIGYSSLQKLNQIPFTEIKIDRMFVDGCPVAKTNIILESIVQMASKLNMRTVAEGIETPAQLKHMRALGCTAGQGFLVGRPSPQIVESALNGDLWLAMHGCASNEHGNL